MKTQWPVRRLLVAAGLVLVSAVPARAREPQLSGQLTTVDGVRVLQLWGDDYQRGYAHGYLLAEDIVTFAGKALVDPRIVASREVYTRGVLGEVLPGMRFAARYEQELQGLLAGVTARLQKAYSADLGRELTVDDLKALNTLADWYAFYCSSFSAWGPLQEAGHMVTARNLDFIKLPGLVEQQLVFVHMPSAEGRRKWVSVGWSGAIGCYTGINEEGVVVAMHDCPPGPRSSDTGFVPRSLALRDAVEQASAKHAVADVQRILRDRPAMFGNNVHVSGPFTGTGIPAAILEYDPDRRRDAGVTPRTSEHNGPRLVKTAVVCTNHYRLRSEPQQCLRYAALEQSLSAAAAARDAVDVQEAFAMLKRVRVWDEHALTAHAVVMLPNTREFYLSLASAGEAAPNDTVAHFTLEQLLKKPAN